MTDSKDGQHNPSLYDELNQAVAKAKLSGEIRATQGIGARILHRRNVPKPENSKGDDTMPPEGKGR